MSDALPPAEIYIDVEGGHITGDLAVPTDATGLVAFAHGSGSSRFSPRNREVASFLRQAGFATLLMDLLTEREEVTDATTREHRFDIPLLAGRVAATLDWLGEDERTRELPIGLFGASTGAASALIGAADRPERVAAVVSRGGRPDLAGDALPRVQAPTMLIVGGDDPQVRELNEQANARLTEAVSEVVVVPGATHLFEEPDALEQVAEHATAHFRAHLQ